MGATAAAATQMSTTSININPGCASTKVYYKYFMSLTEAKTKPYIEKQLTLSRHCFSNQDELERIWMCGVNNIKYKPKGSESK